MESDTQPEEVTSANTEINSLTDKLEEPAPPQEQTRDVQTFWNRLDSLMEHLETTNINKKPAFHSFTNQPERVCISSENDISTSQTQNAVEEQTFNSFKVAIARPFLDVKSIQLLRASIPNAVTNIPDEECTFWYYRLPTAIFAGTLSLSTASSSFTNATFTTASSGFITYPSTSYGITNVFPSSPNAGLVKYESVTITGLAAGSTVKISGVTPAGYNGTFIVQAVSSVNRTFTVINATTGAPVLPAATWTQVVTDYIDWSTVPYSVRSSTGTTRGYFTYPPTQANQISIYSSSSLTGGTVGTISRSSDLYLPAPSSRFLHMVRLLPSYYKAELFESAFGVDSDLPPNSRYGFNKTFTDYTDLATQLALSCAADPAYDIATNVGDPFTIFIPNDISITFNETLNKFIFTGNNDYYQSIKYASYLSAGYEDPNLWIPGTTTYATDIISAPTLYDYLTNDLPGDYNYIRGINGQPYKIYRTLNLRLGFTWNGLITSIAAKFPINVTSLEGAQQNASVLTSFLNRLRPVPSYFYTGTPLGTILQTSPTTTVLYTADSYADLVYTNTVSLYADFTGGSTYDSMSNTQLLACVPMNASNLGVTFYNTTLYCPLTKISDQIYEIEIRMLTDTGAPYVIPNSAIVSLELALTY